MKLLFLLPGPELFGLIQCSKFRRQGRHIAQRGYLLQQWGYCASYAILSVVVVWLSRELKCQTCIPGIACEYCWISLPGEVIGLQYRVSNSISCLKGRSDMKKCQAWILFGSLEQGRRIFLQRIFDSDSWRLTTFSTVTSARIQVWIASGRWFMSHSDLDLSSSS